MFIQKTRNFLSHKLQESKKFVIKVKVKLSSGKQYPKGHKEIEKISENEYLVHLKSPPEDNKANIELLKLLKRYFKAEVKIKSGFTSRNKLIEIMD